MLAGVIPDFGCPVWAVPGNHDLGRGPEPLDRLGDLVRRPGVAESGLEGVHIAAGRLVRSGSENRYEEAALPVPAPWPAGPVIWLSHFPVIGLAGEVTLAGLPYAGDLVNRPAVLDALADHGDPVIVLAGHLHLRATAVAGTVLQLSHPALIERPHQVSLVELDSGPGRLTVTRSAHFLPDVIRASPAVWELTPRRESWTFARNTWRQP